MQRPYQAWIDWLKVLGMWAIIFGHSGGHSLIPGLFQPINAKQLGVAFFVFITGYTLANEKRPPLQAVFNRFFDVFVLGVLLAIFISGVQWIRIGDLNESNYLPFVLGLNVIWENAFPANPTTWYVGTYLHLLLVWALVVRRLPSRWYLFVGLLVLDVGVRGILMYKALDFNAYMIVTSWLSVFYLGMIAGRLSQGNLAGIGAKADHSTAGVKAEGRSRISPNQRRFIAFAVSVVLLFSWSSMVKALGVTTDNPFGRIPAGGDVGSSMITSLSVTFEYLSYTLLVLAIVLGIPAGRFVQFLARNTLFVFLAHMPFRDFITPYYYSLIPGGWIRQVANFFVLFVLLAIVSQVLVTSLRLSQLRKWVGSKLFGPDFGAVKRVTAT